jgi:hypothetical protein
MKGKKKKKMIENKKQLRKSAKYSFLKNGVFWDVTLCGNCKNRNFGGT